MDQETAKTVPFSFCHSSFSEILLIFTLGWNALYSKSSLDAKFGLI